MHLFDCNAHSCVKLRLYYIATRQFPTKFLLIILLFLLSVNAAASEPSVLILKSSSASVYNNIVATAKKRLNRICSKTSKKCKSPSITVKTASDNLKLSAIAKDKDLIIAIGTNAAHTLNKKKLSTPTLYALIPSLNYPKISQRSNSSNKSAIYIDQPISRQLKIIQAALPGKKRVGILLGKYSNVSKPYLEKITQRMGIKLVSKRVKPDNVGYELGRILQNIDVLLALPDPSIYNRNSVKKILLSTFRHRVPVFGYSAAFVKSGAAFGVYSTPRDIGKQIGDEIESFFSRKNRKLSPASHPRYFTIRKNNHVAGSLNLRLPSVKQIRSKIK